MKSDKAVVREHILSAMEHLIEAADILERHNMAEAVNQILYIMHWTEPLYKKLGKEKSF